MPNLDTMVQLVQMIRERKPCYLLDIGGSDICADICGMFVPEITVGTVFSAVAMSCGEYQLLDGKPGTGDLPVLLPDLHLYLSRRNTTIPDRNWGSGNTDLS